MKKLKLLSLLLIGGLGFISSPATKADFANPGADQGMGGSGGESPMRQQMDAKWIMDTWSQCAECSGEGSMHHMSKDSEFEPSPASDLNLDEADLRQRTGTEEATANNPRGNTRAAGGIMGAGGNTVHHGNDVDPSIDRTSLGRDRR